MAYTLNILRLMFIFIQTKYITDNIDAYQYIKLAILQRILDGLK